MHDVLDLREMLADEIVQRRESGYLVDTPEPAAVAAADEAELARLLADVQAAPRDPDWPYMEPPAAVHAEAARAPLDEATLRDRVLGAWLGRCAGCTLGKPVENWPRADIRRYLERTGDYPITDYFQADGTVPTDSPPLNAHWRGAVRGRIAEVPRDDDVDYTILGLHLLEEHGAKLSAGDVAAAWLAHFPFTAVYTAERAAYRNLVGGLQPPDTATHVNPYREWIGAMIRVDAYAYASPGDPTAAARLALADASLSHTANGVYGALWAAALIAAAFTASDMREALATAVRQVPPSSRLAEALRGVAELHRDGLDWEHARDVLEERHGTLSPVHTINNATVVAAALLWGEGDFTRTVGLAVQGGWDTDCSAATAGSAFGAMHGAGALPGRWIEPLGDRVRSALFGFDGVRLTDLAERTYALSRPRR
jgi:ADP-ribosylglycohydrolase